MVSIFCTWHECNEVAVDGSDYCGKHKAFHEKGWLSKSELSKASREEKYKFFEVLFEVCDMIANKSVEEFEKSGEMRPMYININQDKVEVKKSGPEGWAWVNLWPANSMIAKHAVKILEAHPGYRGGVDYTGPYFNRSYQKRDVYARAFADVLQPFIIEYGLNCSLSIGGKLD